MKISSQFDKRLRRKTRKFCADIQTNVPKCNTLSSGEGNNNNSWVPPFFLICYILDPTWTHTVPLSNRATPPMRVGCPFYRNKAVHLKHSTTCSIPLQWRSCYSFHHSTFFIFFLLLNFYIFHLSPPPTPLLTIPTGHNQHMNAFSWQAKYRVGKLHKVHILIK